MKSVFYQPSSPFAGTYPCAPCRVENAFSIYNNGYIYNFVVRDKVIPEDPYMVMMKAYAFSVQFATPYPGGEPPRVIRDALIKGAVAVL
jgi:hypothetical protein